MVSNINFSDSKLLIHETITHSLKNGVSVFLFNSLNENGYKNITECLMLKHKLRIAGTQRKLVIQSLQNYFLLCPVCWKLTI